MQDTIVMQELQPLIKLKTYALQAITVSRELYCLNHVKMDITP